MAVTTITSTTTPVATGTTTKNSGVSSSTTVAKSTVATSSTTATTTASTTARSYVSSATASTTASTTYRVNSSTTSKVTYSSGTAGSSTTPVNGDAEIGSYKGLSGETLCEFGELMVDIDVDDLAEMDQDTLNYYLESLYYLNSLIKESENGSVKECVAEIEDRISDVQGAKLINEKINEELLNKLGWRLVSSEHVQELKELCIKYDINTTERIRNFLAQCHAETAYDYDLIENDNKNETYLKEQAYYPYIGVGRIQVTHEYGYKAFAIYQALSDIPELSTYVKWKNPANNSADIIDTEYRSMLEYAESEGIDISKYTDIVDIGAEYVAKEYGWEIAGYFWEICDGNGIVDEYGETAVDRISEKINKWGGDSSKIKRRDAYMLVSRYI